MRIFLGLHMAMTHSIAVSDAMPLGYIFEQRTFLSNHGEWRELSLITENGQFPPSA
jgi:hypothetical protein